VNQAVALAMLAKAGYRADVAANGREALEALERIAYDLVLMDCQMPEMDGFAATRKLRSPDSTVLNRNVPVIAMTANAMSGDRERCMASGMDDYLSNRLNPVSLPRCWINGWPEVRMPTRRRSRWRRMGTQMRLCFRTTQFSIRPICWSGWVIQWN